MIWILIKSTFDFQLNGQICKCEWFADSEHNFSILQKKIWIPSSQQIDQNPTDFIWLVNTWDSQKFDYFQFYRMTFICKLNFYSIETLRILLFC